MATDPLLERALLDTNLKLGPQASALRSLLSDLAGTYSRTRRVNASNAVGISAATRQARPEVGQAFAQALASSQAQRTALGVGAQDPQAAAFERRVGEQRAGALNDLTQRELRATEGRVYANSAARDEYLGGKAKVLGQLQELAGQSGALTASTLGKLRDDRAQRSLTRRGQDVTADNSVRTQTQSERNSIRSSGIDPDTGKVIPGGKRDTKKVQWAPPAQQNAARDGISQAVSLIEQQRGRGMTSRADIIQLLTTGRAASTREVDGQKVTLPAIPKLSADYVRAASNVVFDGSLSRGDIKRLHARRIRIKPLGYTVRQPGDRSTTQTQRDLGAVSQLLSQQTGG